MANKETIKEPHKEDLFGFRIWEIDEKTQVPKEVDSGNCESVDDNTTDKIVDRLDLKNKTYAIRIGKKGLK